MKRLSLGLIAGCMLIVSGHSYSSATVPAQPDQSNLSLVELSAIYGGSTEGPGCRVLVDKTTCAYAGPPGRIYVCDNAADPAGDIAAFQASCAPAAFVSGVGDVEFSAPPLEPNTNQEGAAGNTPCKRNYTRAFTTKRTNRAGCGPGIFNATKCMCDDTAGAVTLNFNRKLCNDP